MCDWDAEEYAEYLLWVGAEATRARARTPTRADESSAELTTPAAPPPEAAEA
jgi:hypothetical protein